MSATWRGRNLNFYGSFDSVNIIKLKVECFISRRKTLWVCFILLVSKAFSNWKYVPIYRCHLESTRYNTKLSFLVPLWNCTPLADESCSRLSHARESGCVCRPSRGQGAVPLRAAARAGGMAVAGSAMAAAARGAAAGGRCGRCPGSVPSWRPWAAPGTGTGSAPPCPHRVRAVCAPVCSSCPVPAPCPPCAAPLRPGRGRVSVQTPLPAVQRCTRHLSFFESKLEGGIVLKIKCFCPLRRYSLWIPSKYLNDSVKQ